MFDANDFTFINLKTKRYKLICDKCGLDRGYGMKSRANLLCKRCTHSGKCYTDHNSAKFKLAMSKAKKGQTPYNKGKGQTKEQRQLRNNFSTAIRKRLTKRNSSKMGDSYLNKIGYSIEDLKVHLEKQFEAWMNWSNYGRFNPNKETWQIDHIMPDSSFQYKSMDDIGFKLSWSLNNLRPLRAKDNLLKSNKV
jgi:hypothetical protein